MDSEANEASYTLWGPDRTAYGPVELATLVSWLQDERVTADSWVFRSSSGSWQKASEMAEFKELLAQQAGGEGASETKMMRKLNPPTASQLRGVKILAGLTDEQLEAFARYGELQEVEAQSVVVRQGDDDEALYLVLAGEMRVRIVVAGSERVLTTLAGGDCFGDLALLDHGVRSADVVANTPCTLVKVSAAAFSEFCKQEVDTSSLILRALDRILTERIRADNQRYGNALRGTGSNPGGQKRP